MPADPHDLARRVAAATPADTVRGFNHNALFDVVRGALGAEAARELDPAGKGSRTDFSSYPVTEYLRLCWAAVDRLEPRLGGVDAAWYELGARTVTRFLGSMLGRTVIAIAGPDPRRFAEAAPGWYRGAASYGERQVTLLGERRVRAEFRRDFGPVAFHRGVIMAGLQAAGAREVAVDAKALGLLDSEYLVSWR